MKTFLTTFQTYFFHYWNILGDKFGADNTLFMAVVLGVSLLVAIIFLLFIKGFQLLKKLFYLFLFFLFLALIYGSWLFLT